MFRRFFLISSPFAEFSFQVENINWAQRLWTDFHTAAGLDGDAKKPPTLRDCPEETFWQFLVAQARHGLSKNKIVDSVLSAMGSWVG